MSAKKSKIQSRIQVVGHTEITPIRCNQKAKLGEPYYQIIESGFHLIVLRSANAWWLNPTKVQLLIQAFKIDATVEEACNYAGITVRQYQYFSKLHPDFCELKKALANNLIFLARSKLAHHIQTDIETAKWYLAKKRRTEFGDKVQIDHQRIGRDITDDDDPALIEAVEQAQKAIELHWDVLMQMNEGLDDEDSQFITRPESVKKP